MGNKKGPTFKNWLLVKNPQFLSNPNETWWKYLSHEVTILTKFHEDWRKDVDFLLNVNFWMWALFLTQTLERILPAVNYSLDLNCGFLWARPGSYCMQRLCIWIWLDLSSVNFQTKLLINYLISCLASLCYILI